MFRRRRRRGAALGQIGPQYRTLADAAQVTGNPRYGGCCAAVWYAKVPLGMGPPVTLATLKDTHALVGTIDDSELHIEQIFAMMQGEVWSPQGNARSMIQRLGLRHTSMSVGDVVMTGEGEAYEVKPFDWKRVPLR